MPPEEPTNPRFVLPDGSEITIHLEYAGLNGDGIRMWDALEKVPANAQIKVDKIPARTSIHFPLGREDG